MMKRNLKLATALALALASSAALADGFSSMATLGTGVGGSAYGTEQGTQGGFCTGTGVMCGTNGAAVGNINPAGTVNFIGSGLVPTVANVQTAATNATQVTLLHGGTYGANSMESASGAMANSAVPLTGIMAPQTGVAGTPIAGNTTQGTYTSLNAVTIGAYNNVGGQDPGSAANVTGNTYALQKTDLGVANSGSTTSATATALKGQAASFGGIATTAQAVMPRL
jgi:hypothetical protein